MDVLLSGLGDLKSIAFYVFGLLAVYVFWKIARICLQNILIAGVLKPIPTPPHRLPVIGHVFHMFTGRPWDTLVEWTKKYGNLLRISFFGATYVVVADPELVKQVLNTHLKCYNKDKMSYSQFLSLLGTGLVTSEGELWKRQRTLVSTAFRIELLGSITVIAKEAVDRLTTKLLAMKRNAKGQIEVEIGEEFRRLTLQVIGASVLSLTPEQSDDVFPKLYLPIVEECNKRIWMPWRAYFPSATNRRVQEAVDQLNSFVSNYIKDRWAHREEKKSGHGDVLDRIIDGVQGEEWNDKIVRQLRDEIKTFIFAGHETSSLMLTWALFEVSKNPDIAAKILEEANRVFKKGQWPAFDDFKELVYTQNVLKEALRFYSVVPVVTRECVEEDNLGGYRIPVGASLVISIQAVHHRADIWEEPEKFKPERFEAKDINPYAWIPFIAGPRSCLGQHFALLEAKIVLALLVKQFEWKAVPGTGERHKFNVPTCPLNGMEMLATPREL